MTQIRFFEHKYLEPGTVLVSSDIAQLMRERYGEQGRDAAFLLALGITSEPEESPDARPQPS